MCILKSLLEAKNPSRDHPNCL